MTRSGEESVRPATWLLFDFGNVLSTFTYEPFLEFLAAHSARDEAEVRRLFRDEGGLLDLYETGRIGTRKFLAGIRREISPGASVAEIRSRFCGIFVNDADAIAAVRAAGSRFRIAVVSNTNPLHYRHTMRPLLSGLVDLYILSHRIGIKKPERGVFDRFLSTARTIPELCWFFDDMEENVRAARSAGIDAHLVTGSRRLPQLLRDLELLPG